MSEVMLDLETLSTRSNAVILVIAGVKFDRKDKHIPVENMDTFYRRVDIESCKAVGMDINQDTVKWWNSQEKKVRDEAFNGDRFPLKQALREFTTWYGNAKTIWSQGATFDIPILAEAYARCNMSEPWKYYNGRDTRTIYDLAGINPWNLPKGDEHNALADCWRQIWGVKTSFQKLIKK